jgi:hypothetical protein
MSAAGALRPPPPKSARDERTPARLHRLREPWASAAISLARRTAMADNKHQIGEPDRSHVSESEDYEIRYFAKAVGLDVEQVRKLIQRHGNDRQTLEREARKLKGH